MAEKASKRCKEGNHKLKSFEVFKKFFACRECRERTVTYGKLYPTHSCRSAHFTTIVYHKPPNISPGIIFVRKHFLVGLYMRGLIYGGAYIRTRFCVSNINHLLTLFLYNTRLIYKQA